MKVALGKDAQDEYRDNLHKISRKLQGNVGLLFTNETKEDVIRFVWFEVQFDVSGHYVWDSDFRFFFFLPQKLCQFSIHWGSVLSRNFLTLGAKMSKCQLPKKLHMVLINLHVVLINLVWIAVCTNSLNLHWWYGSGTSLHMVVVPFINVTLGARLLAPSLKYTGEIPPLRYMYPRRIYLPPWQAIKQQKNKNKINIRHRFPSSKVVSNFHMLRYPRTFMPTSLTSNQATKKQKQNKIKLRHFFSSLKSCVNLPYIGQRYPHTSYQLPWQAIKQIWTPP